MVPLEARGYVTSGNPYEVVIFWALEKHVESGDKCYGQKWALTHL